MWFRYILKIIRYTACTFVIIKLGESSWLFQENQICNTFKSSNQHGNYNLHVVSVYFTNQSIYSIHLNKGHEYACMLGWNRFTLYLNFLLTLDQSKCLTCSLSTNHLIATRFESETNTWTKKQLHIILFRTFPRFTDADVITFNTT